MSEGRESQMAHIREEFYLWYFNPHKEGTQKEWAESHGCHPRSIINWKQRPEFLAKMEEFRKTYREEGDQALQNLFRFALSPEPRVAIPAIRIVVDVMGYASPSKVEVSTKGMSLMDYLVHVGQKAVQEFTANGGEQPVPPVIDPWQTADIEKLN
jgi:hypothetical protein